MKRILSLVLSTMLLAGIGWVSLENMMPTEVYANAPAPFYDESSGILYEPIYGSEKSVCVLGYTIDSEEITIPEKVNGYVVTEIGDGEDSFLSFVFDGTTETSYLKNGEGNNEIVYFDYYRFVYGHPENSNNLRTSKVKKINLPDTVTTINGRAFKDYTGLEEIHWSDNITYIGEQAFSDCTQLKITDLPAQLEDIGNNAFSDETIQKYETIENGVIYLSNLVYGYQENSFDGKVTIKDGTVKICDKAFNGCKELKEITFPNTLKTIGEYSFSECTGLTEITLPDSLETIGDSAFYKCTGLKKVVIPAGVKEITATAFSFCKTSELVIVADEGTEAKNFAEKYHFTVEPLTKQEESKEVSKESGETVSQEESSSEISQKDTISTDSADNEEITLEVQETTEKNAFPIVIAVVVIVLVLVVGVTVIIVLKHKKNAKD